MKADFEELYDRFFKDVYLFVLSLSRDPHTAEEITQETFFRAFKELKHFKGNCSVRSWLCQIGKNLYLDQLRRNRRWKPESGEEAGERLADGQAASPDVAETCVRKQEALGIYRVLHYLDEPYKEVFTLRALGELSFREIGDIFGKQENWARVTYYRARMKILKELPDMPQG